MKSIAIRYALAVFIVTVLWTVAEHVLGYNTTNHAVGHYTRAASAFIYYIAVAVAIWRARKYNDNLLTFGEGMKTGALMTLIYSLLVTGWFALYAEVINKQFQPTLLAYTHDKLIATHATAAEMEKIMSQERLSSGGSIVSYLLLFTFMFIFGLIVSLLSSLFMRRIPKMTL